MKNKSWLVHEQFSSLLVVVHVACIAGSRLVVLFICVGNTVEQKLWGQRCGRGQKDFLNNYPEVAHSFYFYFTFDWTRLILYNKQTSFWYRGKVNSDCTSLTLHSINMNFVQYKMSLFTAQASHCTVQRKYHFVLFFFISASCIPDA